MEKDGDLDGSVGVRELKGFGHDLKAVLLDLKYVRIFIEGDSFFFNGTLAEDVAVEADGGTGGDGGDGEDAFGRRDGVEKVGCAEAGAHKEK